MRFDGKVAIVTGAANGIGHAVTSALAREGALVYAADIQEPSTPYAEGDVRTRRLDVSDLDAWQLLVKEIADAVGRVDILVNNAGIVGSYEGIAEVEIDAWDRIIAVNQNGVFYGMRSVIPMMAKQGSGAIVNVSSIWGLVGSAGVAGYQASKGAVTMMTRNAAVSYAHDGIRVNSIHPGFIDTPLTQAQDKQLSDELIAASPIKRAGRPDEVASAVTFLASDEASFVIGAQLVVDGGFTAV